MPIIKVYPAGHFVKAYKSLPEGVKTRAKQRENIFLNPNFAIECKIRMLACPAGR